MSQTPDSEQQVLEAVAGVPIFSHLEEKARRRLARLCTLKSFEAGDVLYEEGTIGLCLYVVTSGRVELYRGTGEQKVALETIAAGGVLGQLALLDDKPRAASAVALESTVCLLLTRDAFDTLVKRDPEIAWCLLPALAGRLRQLLSVAAAAKRARSEAAAEAARAAATGSAAAAGAAAPAQEGPAADGGEASGDEEEKEKDDDDDDDSEWSSALFKMMRMQYGMMAGTARGMAEMARAMETFLDSMAEETDFTTKEDWAKLFGKVPEAMVTAARDAMDRCEKVPDEMVDAYRRYSDTES